VPVDSEPVESFCIQFGARTGSAPVTTEKMKAMIRCCVNRMGAGNRMSRRIFTSGYLNSDPKETTHFGFKTVAADEKAKLVEDVFSKV
jgi:hypothetical protein